MTTAMASMGGIALGKSQFFHFDDVQADANSPQSCRRSKSLVLCVSPITFSRSEHRRGHLQPAPFLAVTSVPDRIPAASAHTHELPYDKGSHDCELGFTDALCVVAPCKKL